MLVVYVSDLDKSARISVCVAASHTHTYTHWIVLESITECTCAIVKPLKMTDPDTNQDRIGSEPILDDHCDYEDDDFCSDHSSITSTQTNSSSNNQTSIPETTRVCDCCYCEVFGHGPGSVAPTSRNYAEMRERLRQRLSKRRAERCESQDNSNANGCNDKVNDSNTSDSGSIGATRNVDTNAQSDMNHSNTTTKSTKLTTDQRNLDELLNFINGSTRKTTNGLDKTNNRKSNLQFKDNNPCRNIKCGNGPKSIQRNTRKGSKDDQSKCRHHNHHDQNHNHNQSKTLDGTPNGSQQVVNKQTLQSTASKGQTNQLNITNRSQHSESANSSSRTSSSNRKANGTKTNTKCSNNSKHTPTSQDENNSPQTRKTAKLNISRKSKSRNDSLSDKSNISNNNTQNASKDKPCAKSSQTNRSSTNNISNKCHKDESDALNNTTNKCQQGTEYSPQRSKQKRSLTPDGNKTSRHSDMRLAAHHHHHQQHHNGLRAFEDEVFMPRRDIDLDDIELDEFERELEAFKRFCFDSKPLVKREKVRVEFKNDAMLFGSV